MKDGAKMKVWMAEYSDISSTDEVLPGTFIIADSKKGLYVKTGDGVLELTEIQMPNLKRMSAKEYLRGHTL